AEKQLYLTHAQMRKLYSKTNFNQIRRFIKENPIDLNEVVEEESASTRRSFGRQKEKYKRPITKEFNTKKQTKQRAMRPQTTGAETKSWQTGDKANHKVWGIGTVVSVQGEDESMELDVAFPAPTGIKRLLAKFAPITKE